MFTVIIVEFWQIYLYKKQNKLSLEFFPHIVRSLLHVHSYVLIINVHPDNLTSNAVHQWSNLDLTLSNP